MVMENQTMRVATGVLNEIMAEAVAMQQPPSDKGKRLKLYYITQVAVKPPTFVIFVNDKELMHFSYTRYLENRIRDTFGFKGTASEIYHPWRERKINNGSISNHQCSVNRLPVWFISRPELLYGNAHHVDIRSKGSGNTGTTNSLRVLGWKAGVIVFLGDCLKAVAAMAIIWFVAKDRYPDTVKLLELYAGFGAVSGT